MSIALCDVLFAIDSIPAVLGVSDDPFVVYTSNIAAVVGLRSLYQLLSVAVSDLVYLESAVALVLGFVGLKLGVEVLGVEVSSMESLGVILATLGRRRGAELGVGRRDRAAAAEGAVFDAGDEVGRAEGGGEVDEGAVVEGGDARGASFDDFESHAFALHPRATRSDDDETCFTLPG